MFDVNSKELMIVGGPNGSGKTTFARVCLIKEMPKVNKTTLL